MNNKLYFCLSTLIHKVFAIIKPLFYSLFIESWCPKVFGLNWVTFISVLAPVSDMASFNYDGNKASDVALTCRCYLSNILFYSIFQESTRKGILLLLLLLLSLLLALFLLFLFLIFTMKWYVCFLWDKRVQMGMGKFWFAKN